MATTVTTTSTTTNNGVFFANFTVPPSSIGPVPVIATQGSNSASKTFTVTLGLSPQQVEVMSVHLEFLATSQTQHYCLPSSNQSNASVPILTNSSFDSTKSNGSIAPPLNTSSAQPTENISTAVRADDKELSANTSSAQATENILTASTVQGQNE